MTAASTLAYKLFNLMIGDGEDPEVFAQPCALMSRGFDLSATTVDITVPDCTDEDKATWIEKMIDVLSGSISGSGKLDTAAFTIYKNIMLAGQSVNARMKIDKSLALGGGYFSFAMVMTKFSMAGESKNLVEVDLAFETTGEVTWVDAAA